MTLLVGCGSGEPDAAPTTDAPATAATASPAVDSSEPATTVAEIPAALQFTAPLIGGGDIELGALAGRPVLLWFWAPW